MLYTIFLIKRKIRAYAMLNNVDISAPALYEELELLRRMGQCFDLIACHVARGYCEQMEERQQQNAA